MNSTIKSKQAKFIYVLIFISILMSSFQIFLLGGPDFFLITKSDREKLIELHPEFYEIIYFAEDNTDVGSFILFFDQKLDYFAQPLYYPYRFSRYFNYEGVSDDKELLNYLKESSIDYIVISESSFDLSSNETLFTKLSMNPTNYILKVNGSAL